jgi:hypothetical protein
MTESDYEVSIDPHNLDSFGAAEAYIGEVKELTGLDFEAMWIGRKAAVPDPEIVVRMAEAVVATLVAAGLAKKVTDKLVEKLAADVGEEVSRFYHFLRATILTYVRHARPRNRPVTYAFVLPGQPMIEFVARSNDVEGVSARFGQSVEEEDAAVCKADLAGPGPLAAPDRPACEIVWWGARKGRCRMIGASPGFDRSMSATE